MNSVLSLPSLHNPQELRVIILEYLQQPVTRKRRHSKANIKWGWDLKNWGKQWALQHVHFCQPGNDTKSCVCVFSSSSGPSSEITYGMVAADLFHSLLSGGGTPCVMKVQSLFVLDENSYPLQQDFSLLDFYLDSVKHANCALPWNQIKKLQALQGRLLKWFVFWNEWLGLGVLNIFYKELNI